MAESGRAQDVVDLTGRTRKPRRRARIWGWIGRVICAVIAVTTGVFVVTGAMSLVTDLSAQNAYDKAPYCAGVTNATENCVLRTPASVASIDVEKNTGKNAHGYTTEVFLDPQIGGEFQWVVLSSTEDLSGEVNDGDQLPVLVWRDQITRFTYDGRTHDSDKNPHHLVASDLTQVSINLAVAALFGRPLIRRLLRSRTAINLRRNRIPDWTLVALVVATPVAALLRASYVVVAFGLAGIAVLVLSAAWPFVPWVATPTEPPRPILVGKRSAAAAKKRNQKRPSRLP